MFNGVMLLCRREILRTSRDMLRVQKSPQGLRRAGFQDFISRLWWSPMENFGAGVLVIGGGGG